MEWRFKKDPEIKECIDNLAIAHLKNCLGRVGASRDECRDENAELKERLAKYEAALEKIANHKQTSVDKIYLIHQCEGYQAIAKDALAEK
jgi:hypothetical protein